MDLSEHVKEFRVLQKTHKIRVADYCREHILDYYEMVEALKRDKFLSSGSAVFHATSMATIIINNQ